MKRCNIRSFPFAIYNIHLYYRIFNLYSIVFHSYSIIFHLYCMNSYLYCMIFYFFSLIIYFNSIIFHLYWIYIHLFSIKTNGKDQILQRFTCHRLEFGWIKFFRKGWCSRKAGWPINVLAESVEWAYNRINTLDLTTLV